MNNGELICVGSRGRCSFIIQQVLLAICVSDIVVGLADRIPAELVKPLTMTVPLPRTLHSRENCSYDCLCHLTVSRVMKCTDWGR